MIPPDRFLVEAKFRNFLQANNQPSRNKLAEALYYTTQNTSRTRLNSNLPSRPKPSRCLPLSKQLTELRSTSNLQFYSNRPRRSSRPPHPGAKVPAGETVSATARHVAPNKRAPPQPREPSDEDSPSVLDEGVAHEVPTSYQKVALDWNRLDPGTEEGGNDSSTIGVCVISHREDHSGQRAREAPDADAGP